MGCCVSRSQYSELSPDTILGKPYANIGSDYTIGEELGRGHFGTTYLCVEKSTGKQYACKSISKGGIVGRSEKVSVRREVETMRLLSGQPNIVEFKAAYEDDQFVHIVMEYCAGGTLVDRILDRGHYSERDARLVIRSIVNALSACHCNGVIHRDLKPENFLFTTDDEDATLKASDFGLSFFFEKGDDSDDDMGIVGTRSYLAPEIYNHIYGKQIDIWSAGVILYNLLSGAQPFAAGTDSEGQIPPTSEEARALALAVTERERLNAYKTRKIDFKSDPWPAISDNAKDLIREMLHPDPYRRITATKVLRHPWLKYEDGEASEPIDPAVIYRLKQFRAMNKLKKLALKVIVENLPSDEIRKHKETFKAMDTDDSGSLTYDELKAGLAKLGSTLGEVDIKQCMEAADLDGNGAIDYIEFVTCTTPRHKLERYQHLNKAFKYFDKNNDRFISVDELEAAFKESKGDDDGAIIDDIMSEVDRDKDGRISYDEFYAMMKTKTCLTEASSRNLSHIFLEKNSESL